MTLVYHGAAKRGERWQRIFAEQARDIPFRIWPDIGDPAAVKYLAAWTPPPEVIAALPNLEVLFSVGAGVDQLPLDSLPSGLRVVRMVEPGIVNAMADYVSMAVLCLHRDLPFFIAEQRAGGGPRAHRGWRPNAALGSWGWANSAGRRLMLWPPTVSRCPAGAEALIPSTALNASAGKPGSGLSLANATFLFACCR